MAKRRRATSPHAPIRANPSTRPADDRGLPPIDVDPAPAVNTPRSFKRHDAIAIWFFFALLLASMLGVGIVFSEYVTDLLLALLVTSATSSMYGWLRVRLKRNWIAAALTCVVVGLVVLGPVVFLAVSLSTEAAALYSTATSSGTLAKIEVYLFGEGLLAKNARLLAEAVGFEYTPEAVKGLLGGAIAGIAGFLYKHSSAFLSNALGFFFHLAVMLLAVFYMLLEGARLKQYLFQLSPLPDDEDAMLGEKFRAVGRATFVGNGAASAAQGILAGLAMWVAGVPSPVLWGTVVAVLAFLPMLGNYLVTIPAAIYLILEDRWLAAIIFFVFTSIQGFVIENVVKTRLIGSQMRMHDLVILLSVLGGLGLFGLMGILYGPLIVALFLVLLDLYEHRYRRELIGE